MSILGRSPARIYRRRSRSGRRLLTAQAVGSRGRVVEGDAAATGLDDASADAVIGEAMLTMQSDRAKAAIVAEAHRCYVRGPVRDPRTRSTPTPSATMRRPRSANRWPAPSRSTPAHSPSREWRKTVHRQRLHHREGSSFAPMALLEPRRVIADEGCRARCASSRMWSVTQGPQAYSRDADHVQQITATNLAAIELSPSGRGVTADTAPFTDHRFERSPINRRRIRRGRTSR